MIGKEAIGSRQGDDDRETGNATMQRKDVARPGGCDVGIRGPSIRRTEGWSAIHQRFLGTVCEEFNGTQ
jgi:hypothetical protein